MSGTAHCAVPIENTKILADALKAAGVPVTFYTVLATHLKTSAIE